MTDGLAAAVIAAVRDAGWSVESELRLYDEDGALLAESVDVMELAGFFGLLPRGGAA